MFVADCLPVMLVADGAVAALHGGWRGLAARDRGRGRRPRCASSAPRARSQAALGPSARGCCYEVGEEVHAVFDGYDARVGERNLDLAKVARGAARARPGVERGPRRRAVHDVLRPALFFSHRRDGGVTGRQAGVVWRA